MKFQRVSSQPEAIVLQPGSFEPHSVSEPHLVSEATTTEQVTWSLRRSYASALVTAVANGWQSCLNALVGSSDPVVTKMQGEGGDRAALYSVYDPVVQQRVTGLSEAEVRSWLDQRYYR
ncbi:MAG: hypothetical protein F6K30_15655 [Cyanothece sp. SIO2G6]|nr:hypothetical protein [Cyanothece sp. SIO2G6]